MTIKTILGYEIQPGVSAEEYERLLEAQEDAEDLADARAALTRLSAGEPTIPWEQVRRDLGL